MKKLGKSSKKGFTLVELIVVIVILAVLAAMLVPALVGYIDRAKKEKDYQAASVVYAAAQAAITEAYGNGTIAKREVKTISASDTYKAAEGSNPEVKYGDVVCDLAGVTYDETNGKITNFIFKTDDGLVITQGKVAIKNGGSTEIIYELKTDGTWAPAADMTLS